MKMLDLLKEADQEINKNDLLAVLFDGVMNSQKQFSFEPWLEAVTGMELSRRDVGNKVLVSPAAFNMLWRVPVQEIQESNKPDSATVSTTFLKEIRGDVGKVLEGSEFVAKADITSNEEQIRQGIYKCMDLVQYDVIKDKGKTVLDLLLAMKAIRVKPKDVTEGRYWPRRR